MAGLNQTPDLQSILDNLARFTQDTRSAEQQDDANNVLHASSTLVAPQSAPTPLPHVSDQRSSDPRLKPQSRSTASPQPIDPATITTWQDGLRCVTKIAAQNNQFAASIRRMIDVQRKNEQRWYAERQDLLQTQANRTKSSAQAQSILQSLSNGLKSDSVPDTAVSKKEAEVKELADFDRKIYASQVEVDASMSAELKALGVPYFGTDPSLVVKDESLKTEEDGKGDRAKWSPIVTETQLMELRKRMIQHLEDLYRD